MHEPLSISITTATFSASLPLDRWSLDRWSFYLLLLAAIGDEATELRFESDGRLGPVTCKVRGKYYEVAPIPAHVAEEEILSLARTNDREHNGTTVQIRILLEIGGKLTEVIGVIQPSLVVFHFVNPAAASNEASRMLVDQVNKLKNR